MSSRRRLALAVVAVAAVALGALAIPAAGARGRCGDLACRADMSVSGHAEPQPIRKGQSTSLKLTPKNDGPDAALAVDLQVDVPRQLKILGVRNYGGGSGCTVSGTFVRCDLGAFASQQLAVVRIEVRGKRKGTWISNARVYASDMDDPNGGNGQVSISVLVQGRRG